MILRFIRWLFTREPMCDHEYTEIEWDEVRWEVHERCAKCGHIRKRPL